MSGEPVTTKVLYDSVNSIVEIRIGESTPVTATVRYYNPTSGIIEVEVGKHLMAFGGMSAGYCYAHQSFDCELTPEEGAAVLAADPEAVEPKR